MSDTIAATLFTSSTEKAEWLLLSESALRTGNFPSLDDLLHHALNLWIQQLAPELRWKIALDLYTAEHISSGRAAEIAGLNYFVFMEKLKEQGIPFISTESVTKAEQEQQQSQVVTQNYHRYQGIKRR